MRSKEPEPTPLPETSAVAVTLSASYSTESWDDRAPGLEKFDLPLLYLHREREPTPEAERTLVVNIAGLEAGAQIQIEALSRYVDYHSLERYTATQQFRLPDHPCTSENPCAVRWTLDAASTCSGFYECA